MGANFRVTVPAMIITSDWRGEGRNTTPNRSRSYRAQPAEIISMAQQAMPKVSGHSAELRLQLITLLAVVNSTLSRIALFTPPIPALLSARHRRNPREATT